MEVQYSLQRFGVHLKDIPVSQDGTLLITRHLDYIKECRRAEAMERQQKVQNEQRGPTHIRDELDGEMKTYIEIPGPHDVLLGRGKQYQKHAGNVYLDELVARYKKQYFSLSSSIEKNVLAQAIMKMVYEKNGRFLQRAPAGNKTAFKGGNNAPNLWVQISDEAAWSKVSRRFRK